MAINWVLVESTRMRYAAGASMYFAQGIPYGLMNIAIPAWLASEGVEAGRIASFLAVIILPWAFKLLSGPLMDRFQFPSMGSRRPWILAAQCGMTISFFALGVIDDPSEQIGLLTAIGLLINVFAATQDVAVDGMAIDVTPLDEQGRLNGFLVFGKAVGAGLTSAITGITLVEYGIQATAVGAAAVLAAVLFGFALTIERRGERRLPWSRGSAVVQRRVGESFGSLIKGLNSVLWTRVSLVLMAIMVLDGFVDGYGKALMPIAAVKLFGFTTPQWSQLVAVMVLAGAAVALALGPMIDRFGAKRMLVLTVALVAAHAMVLAQTQYLWENTQYVRVMLSVWVLMGPVTMVCMIALAMTVCKSAASATQFAIYMSLANLGASAGSKTFGVLAEQTSYAQSYLLLGIVTFFLVAIVLTHRHDIGPNSKTKRAPSYTVNVGTGGNGLFFSGALRCPKCRSDMLVLKVEGTEIDRCAGCDGLWFDAGELEQLKKREVAEVIDIGNVAVGKQNNAIEQYRCPRCAGEMNRLVDQEQPHIWFEQCSACEGVYFDAGEFKDLATVSISDLFRRYMVEKRPQ